MDNSQFQEVTVIPKALGWAPRRLRCSLRYTVSGVVNNAGAIFANRRYIPTTVYDVDPLLGNTAVPGLAEYGGIYRLYRTRASQIKVSFSNLETFPVTTYICPVNTDPGANTANYANYLSNRLSMSQTIGPLTGNGVCTMRKSATTAAFAGVPDTQQLDTYCGSSNGGTIPTNNWYWIVGIFSSNTMSAGVNINAVIDMEVEFFELLSPTA